MTNKTDKALREAVEILSKAYSECTAPLYKATLAHAKTMIAKELLGDAKFVLVLKARS